jgi:hypothetical protein
MAQVMDANENGRGRSLLEGWSGMRFLPTGKDTSVRPYMTLERLRQTVTGKLLRDSVPAEICFGPLRRCWQPSRAPENAARPMTRSGSGGWRDLDRDLTTQPAGSNQLNLTRGSCTSK